MSKLIHHFWKNKSWVMTALETFFVGVFFISQNKQQNYRLSPLLSWGDERFLGMVCIVVGVLFLVNVLWDFYFHHIRTLLIIVVGGLWALLTAAYSANAIALHELTLGPFICGVIALNVFLDAYLEPKHKMGGGN